MNVLNECTFSGLEVLDIEAIAHVDALPLLGNVGLNNPKIFKKNQVSRNCPVVSLQGPAYVPRGHSTTTNRQVAKNFRSKWRHAENRHYVRGSVLGPGCWVSIVCHSAILPKNQEGSVSLYRLVIQAVSSNDTLGISYRQKSTSKDRSGEL